MTMPIFRLISVLFLSSCHRIVEKCHTKKERGERVAADDKKDSEEEEGRDEEDEDSSGNESQGKDGSDESFD